MAVMITLTYNPYIPQLSVLVNGKEPPEYSRLVQYSDEDIWTWHNEILNVLYSELKDSFYIQFIGTALDAEIMRYHCNLHERCSGFEFVDFVIKDSLQKRLGALNQYLKKNSGVSYSRTILDAMFVLPPDMQMFMEDVASIDINNLFCSTRIHISNGRSIQFESSPNAYLFVLSSCIDAGLELISKYQSVNPIFLICPGEKNELCQVTSTTIVYESTNENLLGTIFNCFLCIPLVRVFRACYSSVQKLAGNTAELEIIASTNPLIKISIETKLEVGKSNLIRVTFTPPVKSPPKVSFKVLNEAIATTDNMAIYGKQPGSTRLEAYWNGSQKPFETFAITVFKRNRIKKLILSDDELVLGVGDTKKIHCDHSPADADNAQSISWASTDETVITIDRHGLLKCHKKGICRIICTAENVSAQCQCEVKPYLQELQVSLPENADTLSLEPMQEYELPLTLTPVDCIDGQLSILSSDCNVANVIGKKIIAKNVGTATITITNSTQRKKICFLVTVAKKSRFFKALFGR